MSPSTSSSFLRRNPLLARKGGNLQISSGIRSTAHPNNPTPHRHQHPIPPPTQTPPLPPLQPLINIPASPIFSPGNIPATRPPLPQQPSRTPADINKEPSCAPAIGPARHNKEIPLSPDRPRHPKQRQYHPAPQPNTQRPYFQNRLPSRTPRPRLPTPPHMLPRRL